MSIFTPQEIEYFSSQPLGRLATINPQGKPQVSPVGFRYNPELDVIEVGGQTVSKTQKFANIQTNPNVAFVVDDVQPPWKVRGVEIRGTAQALPSGGKEAFGSRYAADPGLIQIHPEQIITWGFDGPRKSRKVK